MNSECCQYPGCEVPCGVTYCVEHSQTKRARIEESICLLAAVPISICLWLWLSETLRRGLSAALLPVAVLSSATACLFIAPVVLADLLLWMRGSGGIDPPEKAVYATTVVIASPLVLGRYAVYGVDR